MFCHFSVFLCFVADWRSVLGKAAPEVLSTARSRQETKVFIFSLRHYKHNVQKPNEKNLGRSSVRDQALAGRLHEV